MCGPAVCGTARVRCRTPFRLSQNRCTPSTRARAYRVAAVRWLSRRARGTFVIVSTHASYTPIASSPFHFLLSSLLSSLLYSLLYPPPPRTSSHIDELTFQFLPNLFPAEQSESKPRSLQEPIPSTSRTICDSDQNLASQKKFGGRRGRGKRGEGAVRER